MALYRKVRNAAATADWMDDMNSETGAIYRGDLEIEAARGRGEPIVLASEEVARAVERGMAMNRHDRRRQEKLARKASKSQRKRRH